MTSRYSAARELLALIAGASIALGAPTSSFALLPLGYAVADRVTAQRLARQGSGVLVTAAQTVLFIRYVLSVLTTAFGLDVNVTDLDASNANTATTIAWMLVELVALEWGLTWGLQTHNPMASNRMKRDAPTALLVFLGVTGLIILAIGGWFSGVVHLLPVWSSSTQPLAGPKILLIAHLVSLIVLLLGLSALGSLDTSRMFWPSGVFVLCITMTLNLGSTRWEMILVIFLFVYLWQRSMPRKIPVTILFTASALTLTLLVIATLKKFSWIAVVYGGGIGRQLLVAVGMVSDYFGGPRPVSISLSLASENACRLSWMSFANDVLGAVPLVSQSINQTDRINYCYNQYVGMDGTSMLIPMLGVGLVYVSFAPWIFSFLSYFWVGRLDRQLGRASFNLTALAPAYLGFYLTMAPGFNTQIVTGVVVTKYLPLLILSVLATPRKLPSAPSPAKESADAIA